MAGTTFADALTYCLSELNASTNYDVSTDNDLYPDDEVTQSIILADSMISGFIVATPGHPRRQFYIQPSAGAQTGTAIVNSGDFIPSHLGSAGSVKVGGFAPEWLSASEISNIRRYLAGAKFYAYNGPYYCIDNERLWYVGRTLIETATIDIAIFAAPMTGSTLWSPPECFFAVCAMALSFEFAKDASNLEAAQYYRGWTEVMRDLIKLGEMNLPEIKPFMRRAA